jgi:hypothetical protein
VNSGRALTNKLYGAELYSRAHLARPSHPHHLDHSTYTWRRVQITKLLVMQFSPFSRYFNPLRSQIFSSAPCSQTPSVCVSPLMLETSFTTIQNRRYILIFTFLDSTRDDKSSALIGIKHYQNPISSRIKF